MSIIFILYPQTKVLKNALKRLYASIYTIKLYYICFIFWDLKGKDNGYIDTHNTNDDDKTISSVDDHC